MTNAPKLANRKTNETTAQPMAAVVFSTMVWAIALTGVVAIFHAHSAFGEGFRNSPAGAFDLGRAGGRIAQVDDSSAAVQNPANLVDVVGTELNLAPSIIYIHTKYTDPSGASTETKNPWKVLPNFFASKTFQDGDYAIGLGVTVPYGLANQWNVGPAFKPAGFAPAAAPYYTELKTINVSPAFSVKLSDKVKIGVGLDVMWSALRFNQFLAGSFLEGRAAGTGFGYGANAGLTWQITDSQRFAATLRTPMTVNYSGDFRLTGLFNSSSSFNSQIRYPTTLAFGYGVQVTDKIRVESDLEWLQFSRFQNLPVNLGANPAGVPSQSIPENWKDTITIGLAGDWQFAPDWTLRGGYQYYQSPVPDSTLSPTIPDANQNVLTVGLNYKHKHHAFEFAYGLDFYDKRTVNGPQNPLPGTFQTDVHLFSLSYRYSF